MIRCPFEIVRRGGCLEKNRDCSGWLACDDVDKATASHQSRPAPLIFLVFCRGIPGEVHKLELLVYFSSQNITVDLVVVDVLMATGHNSVRGFVRTETDRMGGIMREYTSFMYI